MAVRLKLLHLQQTAKPRILTHNKTEPKLMSPCKNKISRSKRCLFVLTLSLGITACGGGGGSTPSTAPSTGTATKFSAVTTAKSFTVDSQTYVAAANQFIVMLAEDVTPAQHDAIVAKAKEVGATSIGFLQDMRMLQILLPTSVDELAAISSIEMLPGVVYAGLNLAIETSRANPPYVPHEVTNLLPLDGTSPPSGGKTRSMAMAMAIGTSGRYWVDQIDLPTAWAVETELGISTGPRIAVVDTGLIADQSIIAPNRVSRVDEAGNTISGDTTSDVIDHGLWVSAFAAGNSYNASGVSRFTKLLMVDVYKDECSGIFSVLGCPLGIGRTFQTELAQGVSTAINSDARVINVSWGPESKCSDTEAELLRAGREFREGFLAAATNLARRKDKLIVLAASNDCEKRDDQLLTLPDASNSQADSWKSHVLIVAASTEARKDALFSRMGKVVNLAAPGEQISWGGGTGDGTSYAAPLVLGVAGIIQGISPDLSAPETRYLIMQGAEAGLTHADIKSVAYKGYVGENALEPGLLLNAGNSAKASKLVRNVALDTLPVVSLVKDATKDVSFDVSVPSTGVPALDVVFLVDVTGSYADDISTLKSQASTIVDSLFAKGIDIQFGVAAFADFPIIPFGSTVDIAFQRLSKVTGDKTAVLNAINALSIKSGYDEPEAQLEALYQVATGAGRDLNGDGVINVAAGDFAPQSMGFRTGAAKIVLLSTDASFHDSDSDWTYPGAGFTATTNALKAQGITVIVLQSGTTSSAAADIAKLVAAVGGSSYQLSTSSAEITNAISAGVDTALAQVALTVDKVGGDEWVTSIMPAVVNASPGEKVTFTVSLVGRKSQSIDDLNYDAYLWVRGNGSAVMKRVKIPIKVLK